MPRLFQRNKDKIEIGGKNFYRIELLEKKKKEKVTLLWEPINTTGACFANVRIHNVYLERHPT